MTSRERAEKLAEGFGGWTQSSIETVRMAIDAAVAEEREACALTVESCRSGFVYTGDPTALIRARGAK